MRMVPPVFSNADYIEFLLVNGNFKFLLLTVWVSSDGINVKENFILLLFFATLLQNVWNTLNTNCMNLIIF